MADVFLAKFEPLKSASRRRELLKKLRDTARRTAPKNDSRYKVGSLNQGSFKVEVPGGSGTVHHDGAFLDLDEPEAPTISLIYELAKAGGMAMVDAGASGTILFDKAQLKTVPAEFRRPRPAICASAAQLARMLGFSLKDLPSGPPPPKQYRWSILKSTRWDRLPGFHENPKERELYVETKPGEALNTQLDHLFDFIKALKKRKKLPEGGGITSILMHWELRLPGGEVFIPWHVTGYGWRANTENLILPTLEKWLAIARAFARQTSRRTGIITRGKALVLDTESRYPLSVLESRYVPDNAPN
jgi:hypothetical protein